MSNSSIWPNDRTLSSATTMDQSGPECDGNDEVFCIPQSSSITGATSSDCLGSYPWQSLRESYSSTEMQSVHSTASVNWVTHGGGGLSPSAEMQSMYSTSPANWATHCEGGLTQQGQKKTYLFGNICHYLQDDFLDDSCHSDTSRLPSSSSSSRCTGSTHYFYSVSLLLSIPVGHHS